MANFEQYNVVPYLTPVRVVSVANIAGTYSNGATNNGVGATLTIAASSLTVDSVVLNISDRVLLTAQTSAFQNGIYVVNSIGTTVVLTRSADMQSIEQIRPGFYVNVGAGTIYDGSFYSIVEPLPAQFGINSLVFNTAVPAGNGTAAAKAASNNSLSTVASTAGSGFTAGDVVTAADTAGTVQDSGILGTNIVVKNAINTMAAGSEIILDKGTGTEAANAVTISKQSGVITTSSLTTAGGATYVITLTNTLIATSSVVLVSLMGGTNTTWNITVKATAASGSSVITIYNNTASTALNGTLIIGFEVV